MNERDQVKQFSMPIRHNNAMPPSVSDISSAGADMTLSDLDAPAKARVHPPHRSSRFTLLAQRAEQNNSNEADESYIDEGQNDDDAELLDPRPDHGTDLRGEHAVDLPENEVVEDLATPKVVDRSVEPASQTPQQSPANPLHYISEEDKLRQQLIDMQRLNEAFSSYHTAIQAVREKQKVAL